MNQKARAEGPTEYQIRAAVRARLVDLAVEAELTHPPHGAWERVLVVNALGMMSLDDLEAAAVMLGAPPREKGKKKSRPASESLKDMARNRVQAYLPAATMQQLHVIGLRGHFSEGWWDQDEDCFAREYGIDHKALAAKVRAEMTPKKKPKAAKAKPAGKKKTGKKAAKK